MKMFYKVSFVVLSYVFLIFNEGLAQAPNWAWVKGVGGAGGDVAYSIVLDSLGNIYTAGVFEGTVDFDPGNGISNLTSNGDDIFISKLDISGNYVWAKVMRGTGVSYGSSIILDDSGNVYVTGNFQGTVDFDPGPGTFNLTAPWYKQTFILKLDNSGNFVWAKTIDGNDSNDGLSISLDVSKNVYVTGSFLGTADFDPNVGTYIITASDSGDNIFILKLDNSGNFKWAKIIGDTSSCISNSIAIDLSGNILITGYFSGIIDFDPDTGIFDLTAAGNVDIFICKLDSSGNFVWAKAIGGIAYDEGQSVILDRSGNAYVTGYFEGTVDFDPGAGTVNLTSMGGRNIFISKLDNFGNFVWAKSIAGNNDGSGRSIAVDAANNVYTTGYFYGTADFDPDSLASLNLSSAGVNDIFIFKLDSSGNFIWAKATGGICDDFGFSIAVDAAGNIYETGTFASPTLLFDSITLTNHSGSNCVWDIFISKLDNNLITGTETTMQPNLISLSPNPTTTSCTITAPNFTNATLVIYDITGRALLQQPFNERAMVNVAALTPGMYVVEVRDKEGRSVKGKMVRE